MSSAKEATTTPPDEVTMTVVTTSGNATVTQPGSATVRSVIQQAFADLGITTPLGKFTLRGEDDQPIDYNDKLGEVCSDRRCKIYVDPPKVENA